MSYYNVSSSGDPGGSNKQVQYNKNGLFAGSSNFTYDDATNVVTVGGNVAASTPTLDGHLATKAYVDGLVSGLDWQNSVKDKDLNTPPGAPASGDRYIIGSAATGDWAGEDGKIAEYNGTSWEFFSVNEGYAVWVEDEDNHYVSNGSSWSLFSPGGAIDHGSLTGLADDDHSQYHNESRANTWLGTKSSNDITEGGANLYHTSARAISAVGGSVDDSGTAADDLWSGSKISTELAGKAAASHTHAASDITSGTFADARIASSSVTQHEGDISIAESQISDLGSYASASHTHTASDITDFDTEVANNTSVASNTTHRGLTNNPHAVTKAQVGLSNADNTSDANKPVSTATQTALDAKASTASLTAHTGDTGNPHAVTKAQVGLGSVENKSSADIRGEIVVSDIPALATSKITSGTFADARISDTSVTQHEGVIDHDALSGFVANEHINHSSVAITAGNGLTGGGNITTSRTLNVGAGTGITVNADSIQVNESAVNHDSLSGYVANEHIDWTTDQGASNIHAGNIASAAVTQHQSALSITESQISDLGNYVQTTGSETIAGTKTFSTGLRIEHASDDVILAAKDTNGTESIYLTVNDGQGNFNLMAGVDDAGLITRTNDGSGKLLMTYQSGDGEISINAGQQGTAGQAPDYNIGISLDSGDQFLRIGDPNNNVGLYNNNGNVIANVSGELYTTDKLYHTGDTNTYLSFPSADTIVLGTGGTDYLTLNNSVLNYRKANTAQFEIESTDSTSYSITRFITDSGNSKFSSATAAHMQARRTSWR